MSAAAPKVELEELHALLTTHFLSVLKNPGMICPACERSMVDPRILTTAARFVKEAGIEPKTGDTAKPFESRIPEDELGPLPEENNDPL